MASPANFEVTPSFGVVLPNTKINFGKLYLRQILSGTGTNQSDVINPNVATGLGQTSVNNWGIYDGIAPGANLVAYGQGMHTYAGNWQNWFTMVFEVQRFKGSTLQIMGASLGKSNQWAIVGGTGDFAMAHGVIKITEYSSTSDGKIHELTINGYCHMELPPVPTPTRMGPWGGNGGSATGMDGKSRRLESVTLHHMATIYRMSFSYANEDGQICTAGPWGTNVPDTSSQTTIKFGPSEFVKELTGKSDSLRNPTDTFLTDFRIVTNVRTYGPFGTHVGSSPFKATVPNDKTVVGFFAQASNCVFKIGLYTI